MENLIKFFKQRRDITFNYWIQNEEFSNLFGYTFYLIPTIQINYIKNCLFEFGEEYSEYCSLLDIKFLFLNLIISLKIHFNFKDGNI